MARRPGARGQAVRSEQIVSHNERYYEKVLAA
jgi:hypothetical protein